MVKGIVARVGRFFVLWSMFLGGYFMDLCFRNAPRVRIKSTRTLVPFTSDFYLSANSGNRVRPRLSNRLRDVSVLSVSHPRQFSSQVRRGNLNARRPIRVRNRDLCLFRVMICRMSYSFYFSSMTGQ